jgi:hypothetical protein
MTTLRKLPKTNPNKKGKIAAILVEGRLLTRLGRIIAAAMRLTRPRMNPEAYLLCLVIGSRTPKIAHKTFKIGAYLASFWASIASGSFNVDF